MPVSVVLVQVRLPVSTTVTVVGSLTTAPATVNVWVSWPVCPVVVSVAVPVRVWVTGVPEEVPFTYVTVAVIRVPVGIVPEGVITMEVIDGAETGVATLFIS